MWSLKIKCEDWFPSQVSPVRPFPSSALLIMFSSVQWHPPYFALLNHSTCFSCLLGDIRGIFVTFSFLCNKHPCRSSDKQAPLTTKSVPWGGNAVWITAMILFLSVISSHKGMIPDGSTWGRGDFELSTAIVMALVGKCCVCVWQWCDFFSAPWCDPGVSWTWDSLGGSYTEVCITLVFRVS